MIKFIVKEKNPEILVVTPLKSGDKVSTDTLKTIKKNHIPFEWITYMAVGNPAKNTATAYNKYKKSKGLTPPYIIKIDNDIIASKGFLEKLYITLSSADEDVAYSFSSFEFKGSLNMAFDSEFDHQKLLENNYISSCSLIKTSLLDKVGGFVTDDKYFRLLDWCLWLRFLQNGFIGRRSHDCHFVAISKADSVSGRGREDFLEKQKRVKKDFVDKLIP